MKQHNEKEFLAYWLSVFLLDELTSKRNYSINTQKSYRDTFILFFDYMQSEHEVDVMKIKIDHIVPENIIAFLDFYEQKNSWSAKTRNHRLAAIKSFCKFYAQNCIENASRIMATLHIYSKKEIVPTIDYLTKDEICSLLGVPNRNLKLGNRNYLLLLFLYNTGARVSEVAQVRVCDLRKSTDDWFVKLHGKGKKDRDCPLWPQTATELSEHISMCHLLPEDQLFAGIRNGSITRHGVYSVIKNMVDSAKVKIPSLLKKSITPHSLRHTAAIHLLQSGSDIVTISKWLGHNSIETTNKYITIDLETKNAAVQKCSISTPQTKPKWRDENLRKLLKSI